MSLTHSPTACAALLALALALLPMSVGAQPAEVRHTTPIFRLGGPNADDVHAFPEPPRLIVDAKGYIYARIPSDGAVTVFDPDGAFVRRIGGKGEGPGEFQIAAAHGLLGDTLWIVNWPTPRVSRFLTNGTHTDTERTPFDYGRTFGGPVGLDALLRDGRAVVLPPSPVLGVDEPIRLPVLLGTAPAMDERDTIASMATPRGMFIPGLGTWTFTPVAAPPLVAMASNGTGVAVATWSDTAPGLVEVRLHAPDGSERWRRSIRLDARVIPASVRDSLIAVGVEKARQQFERARAQGRIAGGSLEKMVERGLSLPRHFAPVDRLLIGIDETVWLQQMNGLTPDDWLVLDRAGALYARVRVPVGLWVEEASMRDIWGTEQDDLDVAWMVRLRVVGR